MDKDVICVQYIRDKELTIDRRKRTLASYIKGLLKHRGQISDTKLLDFIDAEVKAILGE
jgi:hypothetical protein